MRPIPGGAMPETPAMTPDFPRKFGPSATVRRVQDYSHDNAQVRHEARAQGRAVSEALYVQYPAARRTSFFILGSSEPDVMVPKSKGPQAARDPGIPGPRTPGRQDPGERSQNLRVDLN